MTWTEHAVCRDIGPSQFYSDSPNVEERAKSFCRRCPVVAECLEHAMTRPEEFGVWGGLNAVERVARRRAVSPGPITLVEVTYTTNARSTGSTCSAGRTATGGWGTLCKTHGHTAVAGSRTIAEYAVSRPEEWCPECEPR